MSTNAETDFAVIAIFISIIVIILILRLVYILPACSSPMLSTSGIDTKTAQNPTPIPQTLEDSQIDNKLMCVLGSGGHTGEMISILEQFKLLDRVYSRNIRFVISSGDSTSLSKIKRFLSENEKITNVDYLVIPRARTIGEAKISTIRHTILSLLVTLREFFQLYQRGKLPDVLLCNGPGTCIPIAYTLFFFKFLGLAHTRIIYVESLARVDKLSLTGLLIMPITNRFLVQWQKLAKKYKRCEYYGVLV